jgi:hypothetical protein
MTLGRNGRVCLAHGQPAGIVAAPGRGATNRASGTRQPMARTLGCVRRIRARRPAGRGPADRSEPGELRVGLADSLGPITEVDEYRGLVHRDHASQAVSVVGDLIAQRERLDRPDDAWGVEGTSGQGAPLRGVGWLHHFQYAPVSHRSPDRRGENCGHLVTMRRMRLAGVAFCTRGHAGTRRPVAARPPPGGGGLASLAAQAPFVPASPWNRYHPGRSVLDDSPIHARLAFERMYRCPGQVFTSDRTYVLIASMLYDSSRAGHRHRPPRRPGAIGPVRTPWPRHRSDHRRDPARGASSRRTLPRANAGQRQG